jgi:hypothetical protein
MMEGEKKVNLVIKIINAIASLMSKIKINCHSNCCESDCMLNEEEKQEIVKKKSLTPSIVSLSQHIQQTPL